MSHYFFAAVLMGASAMIPRLLESIHGHLGVLAAAALLHPAILLRKGATPSFRGKLSILLTTLAVVLAFATGLSIYERYRLSVRAPLFHASARAGLLFESKEHLAYAVAAMTLGASVCALAAPPGAESLRKSAALVYALAAATCLTVVILGTYVASVRGFANP